ncbi:VOC family protein [Devosia sp.]|uniref:VOC family protein n=1 Tax=Devosia sp. TaxID=1871048 RepID=UPI002F0A4837
MQANVNRILFNVLAKDLRASVEFYRRIANLQPVFESEWYVVLSPAGQPNVQIGLIDQVSEFAPRHAWGVHEGSYLTLVVDDVRLALREAREMGLDIIEEPVALNYGQTRMLIRDPNGLVIDISTPTADLARLGGESAPPAAVTAIDQPQPEDSPR